DLLVGAAHPHLLAVRSLQDVAEAAADPGVDVADGDRPVPGPEPALEQLGLEEGLEDQVAWGVEDARHQDLAVAGGGHLQVAGVPHVRVSPSSFSRVFSSSNRVSRRWKLSSQNWR